MLVSVEVFSEMLGVGVGEVVFSLKNGMLLNGLKLPTPSYSSGRHTTPMFNMKDVVLFVREYKDMVSSC